MRQECARAQLGDGSCPAATGRLNTSRCAIGTRTTEALAASATLLGSEGGKQYSTLLGSVLSIGNKEGTCSLAAQSFSGLHSGVHLGVV